RRLAAEAADAALAQVRRAVALAPGAGGRRARRERRAGRRRRALGCAPQLAGRLNEVQALVSVLALAVGAVNVFGAWAVSRRRAGVARLFMLAAAVLTVAGVAYAFTFAGAWWILISGCVLTVVASYLNARLVLGSVAWPNHLARAAAMAALVL